MRNYVQRSILKGETRPNYKSVSPTLICSTPILVAQNGSIIPGFDYPGAPNSFTLILEEDSFGSIQSHSIAINNGNVEHIRTKIEAVTKINNGVPTAIFKVDSTSAFITISAPNSTYIRVLPLDGADYEESAHVHLGLLTDPDPRGTVYKSDFNLRSATNLDNKTSILTSYIAPYEDRTSESVNRAIDSVANNTENNYLDISDTFYNVVHLKADCTIGNDELISYIQNLTFTADAFVPVLGKKANFGWNRSLKPEVIQDSFAFFTEGTSSLDIVGYATNKPIYVYHAYNKPVDLPKVSTFLQAYEASRNFIQNEILPNQPSGNIGYNPCTNTTKVFTNNGVVLGGQKSLESYMSMGHIDDVLGNDDLILSPTSFWIVSAESSQANLDSALNGVISSTSPNFVFKPQQEFNQVSKFGWVSYPGTLYGTKALVGSFKCIDRGTIRYVSTGEESLPGYISEGMLVTNGLDAYEVDQVVDQKTLLLKPINDYNDILLGDVSLLQRTELIPDMVYDFDIYFGRVISKRQIAVFATKPISVESIIKTQRDNDTAAPNRLVSGEETLDLGVLVRIGNTRINDFRNDNQNDAFDLEETIGTIDKRLALFNKFLRSTVGTNLTLGDYKSPISLEALANTASDTRSPFKVNDTYLTNPSSVSKPFDNLAYNTVPQVLADNYLRKNSTNTSFVSAREIVYTFREFEQRIVNRVKKFCNLCFVNSGFLSNPPIGQFSVASWQVLLISIEKNTIDLVLSIRNLLQNENFINLPGITLPQAINTNDPWFKQLVGLVYSLLNYYGYASKLTHLIPRRYFETTTPNLTGFELYENVKQQCITKMGNAYNSKYIGAGIIQLYSRDQNVYEQFNIKDLGKPFLLCYVHTGDNALPYVKQARVYMQEWYNASCAKFAFEGLDSALVEGMFSLPCLITYSSGDIKQNSSIVEILNKESKKVEIIDSLAQDSTLINRFATNARVASVYTMETSYSSVVIGLVNSYIYMPNLNIFANDCRLLTLLPNVIGSYINLDLATMVFDLMDRADLSNQGGGITTSQDFLRDYIQPFFDTEVIIAGNGTVLRILPKQNVGVSSVYLDIKIATTNGASISKIVKCTNTYINYDGTVFFKVSTNSLLNESDRDTFRYLSPNNILDTRIASVTTIDNVETNKLEINDPGLNAQTQFYVYTLPLARNLLANNLSYARAQWFSERTINVFTHIQPAVTNILHASKIKTSTGESGVITSNISLEKVANNSTISLEVHPSASSFLSGRAPNPHITIESDNDSTAISILQRTSKAQGENKERFRQEQGELNSIKAGVEIKTHTRAFNEQSLEIVAEHPTLYRTPSNKLSQNKIRQAGVSSMSMINTHSVTPAILGVAVDNFIDPTTPQVENFAIGAVSALSRIDNQQFAQNQIRPANAALQTNQNVIIDDSIIYEGSDNVATGNARTNWRGTGFKRLGGRATSINTITSARQIDLNTPPGNDNSYQSPHHKVVNKKIFRYVDAYSKIGQGKGRGFSSENVALLGGRSSVFKDTTNTGISYEELPNYIGENDILFAFTFKGALTYSPVNNEKGLFSVSGIFNSIGNGYTFSRFADSNRVVSIRAKFGPQSPTYFRQLTGTGFATGKLPSAAEAGDIAWTPENLYADGFLLDSLITDDMARSYADTFGYVDTNDARLELINQALGITNDPQQNWLASIDEIEVILHGREWNANLHSLVVSGELSIGNNLKDKTLSIIVDKERESALFTVPNGGLNIDAKEIYLGSDNVTGPGVISLEKSISSTKDIELGISKEIGLMMLPLRPVFSSGSIVGSTQAAIRNINGTTRASLYFISESTVDTYTVPSKMDPPNASHASKYTSTTPLTGAQKTSIVASRKNILDFQNVKTSARIIGATIEYSRDLLTHNPNTSQVIQRTNHFGETNTACSRDELEVSDLNEFRAIGKKYLVMDLADYLTHEKDATIQYLKSYTTFDIASTDGIVTSEITASVKNDAANSFQLELSDVLPRLQYDQLTNTDPRPRGLIRAFTTADDVTDDIEYSFTDPLNISKLEASCLNVDLETQTIPTVFFTQDYFKSPTRYQETNEIYYVRKLKSAGDLISTTLVTRYNARAYVRPVIFENNWTYVMEVPFKGMILTIKLNSIIKDGYVYPSVDYRLSSSVQPNLATYQSTLSTINLLSDYKRECVNNTIDMNRVDINGNKSFFTRPCITWVSAHVEFTTQNGDNFGQIINAQIQPAHYMPAWIDRTTLVVQESGNGTSTETKYSAAFWHNKHQMASAYNFQDIMKFLRASSEIVIKTLNNSTARSAGIIVSDSGTIFTRGYNAEMVDGVVGNVDYFLNPNYVVGEFPQDPGYKIRVFNFINNALNVNTIICNQDIIRRSSIDALPVSGYKKSLISVQESEQHSKKVFDTQTGHIRSVECEAFNRAYYNVINRLDFLNGQSMSLLGNDGEFTDILDVSIFEEKGFTDWIVGSNRSHSILNSTDYDRNIGSFIKAFLMMGVDVCRIYRMINAGLTLPTETIPLTDVDNPLIPILLSDKRSTTYPQDGYDPRQYGVYSKLNIPHILKFTRK